jgi:TonB-dependent SusC/RagA subfamily outer membrane receptor
MKMILLLSLAWLSALLPEATAQTRTITGRVTDMATNQGLPGVTAFVKGTRVGTTTDDSGNYTLHVPPTATTLVFSYVGYTPVEQLIGNATTIHVGLAPDAKQLGEVVVTALGIARERKSLSYSTQQVSGAQVARAGNPNITNALQGKVSGVTVRQSSGMPGASSHITIRGSRFLGEFADNSPLYVVDGLPVASNSDFVPRGVGADYSSRALDINPHDIESVNVLKGAAAAALYGLRAANGVVIITTKSGRGVIGKPGATVTVNSDFTFDRVSRLPDLQDVYAQGYLDAMTPVFDQFASTSWGPRIDQLGTYNSVITGQPVNGTGKVYDNIDPFFQTGYTTNNGVNISQAGEMGNYSVGAGYTRQEGIIPTTGMERMNAKIAGDFYAGPKVRLGLSANYSDLHVDKIAGGNNFSNPLFTTYFAPRSFDLWGLPFERPENAFVQYHYRDGTDNPRWALKHNAFFEDTRRFSAM